MKVGIVGLGDRIADLAPEFVKANPEMGIIAVSDPSHARLPVLEALGATPALYDNMDAMLSAHSFDMLMIGSPNHMHLDHLRRALETDVPLIFAEKPLVITIDQTLELARLIAAHDGKSRIIVGMVLRYSPLFKALKTAQSKGYLGEIMSIEASEHIAPEHGSFFMRDWRRDSAMSGGFMLEKCCHDLDLYQGVVGSRPLRVASFAGRKKYLPQHRPTAPNYLGERQPRWNGTDDAFSGDGDLVDYQTALVQYDGGATMAFHTNLNVPDEYRRFAVIGRDGMAEGDFVRNSFRVTLSDDGRVPTDLPDLTEHANATGHYGADAEMAHDLMAYAAGTLTALPLSCIDALEAGITALAIDQAMQSETVVDLTQIWTDFDAALAGERTTS